MSNQALLYAEKQIRLTKFILEKMKIKVFIENESGSNLKNIHDEKTLKYKETIKVSRKYPYPYGFVLNTTGEDGDNLDVFVFTERKLKRGEIIECEVIGLMEQFEKSWDKKNEDLEEIDHNILALELKGEEFKIEEEIKLKLREFVLHIFDDIKINKTRVGRFLDKSAAIDYIEKYHD